MTLDRPLVWLDYETTGKRPATARIVQFGMIKCLPDGSERSFSTLVNPGIPIPKGATATHGITDEMVQGCQCGCPRGEGGPRDGCRGFRPWPTFRELARRVVKTFEGCDFGGFNVRYDLDVTAAELEREGIQWNWDSARLVDGFRLWQVAQPRSLSDAVRELLGERLDDAHDAVADVNASRRVVKALMDNYQQLGGLDVAGLHELSFPREPDWVDKRGKIYWEGTEAAMSFGKHKGKALRDLPRSYMTWMVKPDTDFSEEVKAIIRNALDGVYPTYEEEACEPPGTSS